MTSKSRVRMLLDTNMYSLLCSKPDAKPLREHFERDENTLVYGFPLVYKELRNAPTRFTDEIQHRNAMLNLYRDVTVGTLSYVPHVQALRSRIYQTYQRCKGIRSAKSMHTDFALVACAMYHGLDVVVSNDRKTLLSKTSRLAYQAVGIEEGLLVPNLWTYGDLQRRYL